MTTFDQLVDRARSLVTGGERAVLGITGAPGAGKSTLAERLLAALATTPPAGCEPYEWVAHVPMDGFHLADVQLERLHRRDRKGAPDTFDAAGYAALLQRIRDDPDETIYAPGFERTLEQPIAAAIAVPRHARLVVTEGNYLLVPDPAWMRVRSMLTEVWYIDLDEQERLRRLIERHVQFGKAPDTAAAWANSVDQPNAVLIHATRAHADFVVPSGVLES